MVKPTYSYFEVPDVEGTARRAYTAAMTTVVMPALSGEHPEPWAYVMPPWEQLPEPLRAIWRVAAATAYREGFNDAY